jgi:hypothetical protein
MRKVKLPQTVHEFDRLVDQFRKYGDEETVVAIIAQTVRYAAKEQMYVPRDHIVHSIQKIAANEVADKKLEELKLAFLVKKYMEDPADPQVLKALQKLADEGNHDAKELLEAPVPLRSV